MGYRDDAEALRGRIEQLEGELSRTRARAEEAERQIEDLAGGRPTVAALRGDAHFAVARGLLWVHILGWVLFCIVAFPGYITLAHEEGFIEGFPPVLAGILMAVCVVGAFSPIAVSSAIAAIGLRKGKQWGWVAAVFAFAISCLGCVPIGAYGLFVMLRDPVRRAFFPGKKPVTG